MAKFNEAAANRAQMTSKEITDAVNVKLRALPPERRPKTKEEADKLLRRLMLEVMYERYKQECTIDEAVGGG